MADYAQDAVDALASIREDGMAVLLEDATGAFNPATRAKAAGTATYAGYGVLTSHRTAHNAADVQVGRSQVLLLAASGLAAVPKPGWKVYLSATAVAANRRQITSVDAISPAGVDILYKLGLEA